MQVIKQDQVQEKIIRIRNQKVIVDADVAELYGAETKRINEAVKNNPEKFPKGYLFELNKREKNEAVENFDRFKKLKHSIVPLKAFTEKGLYMLATVTLRDGRFAASSGQTDRFNFSFQSPIMPSPILMLHTLKRSGLASKHPERI